MIEAPDGIVVTFGAGMIKALGGLRPTIKHFLYYMATDEGYWMHKCKNKPKHDVLYVYIIIGGRVAYRCFYGGHQTNRTVGQNPDGSYKVITWPRIILAGPVERAPYKIPMRGHQGFHYTAKLF